MNCANHPDRPATAFCQNCGKPLCHACTRAVDGLLLCEPDFAARAAAAGPGRVPAQGAAGYRPVEWAPTQPNAYPAARGHASPLLAGTLGCIPGVGAMYNGQFIKALLHVVVFIVLVGASERFDLAGLLVAAWVFYQIFDAAQTASARRDGSPLPDPFGILDLSHRLGPQNAHTPSASVPYSYQGAQNAANEAQKTAPFDTKSASFVQNATEPAGAVAGSGWEGQAHDFSRGHPPANPPVYPAGNAGWQALGQLPPYGAMPVVPSAPMMAAGRRSEPIGAIVLIVVGLLFLLSTLGVLSTNWIGRSWPVLVLLLGVWLLIRRLSAPIAPPVGGIPAAPYMPGAGTQAHTQATGSDTGTGAARNPLSITSRPAAVEEGSASRTDEEAK